MGSEAGWGVGRLGTSPWHCPEPEREWAVFELVPGEQGLCGGDDHHDRGPASEGRRVCEVAEQVFPTAWDGGSKYRGESRFARQRAEERMGNWGKPQEGSLRNGYP